MKKIVSIVLILSMIMTFEFVSFGNDNSDDIKSILERGGRITLENDYVLKGKAEINKDTIIDLNGHIISCTNSDALVLNEGELYIEDTSSKKPSKTSEGLNVVVDGGLCCIYGGYLGEIKVNNGKCFIGDGVFAYEVYGEYKPEEFKYLSKMSLCVYGGECKVFGGTFSGEARVTEGELIIYNAEIWRSLWNSGGTLKIYDGVFKGENERTCGGYAAGLSIFGGDTEVYGGTFSGGYTDVDEIENMISNAVRGNLSPYEGRETNLIIYGGNFLGKMIKMSSSTDIIIIWGEVGSQRTIVDKESTYKSSKKSGKGSPFFYNPGGNPSTVCGWWFPTSEDYPEKLIITPSKKVKQMVDNEKVAMPELPKVDTENNPQQIENFKTVNTYTEGQFIDVKTSDWSCKNIAKSYELGLMKGNSANSFNPKGNVTIAEAVTMAARLNSIYNTGEESFIQSEKWYQIYVDYAKEHGIVEKEYDNYQKAITREEFASILASAFPDEALAEMNSVSDNSIPDISDNSEYKNSIYKLYRAGILTGNDSQGTFTPKSSITREAASAIITRMACPELRQSIKL